jgi:L-ribulokinase
MGHKWMWNAGVFPTVEQAQDKICPEYRTFQPDPSAKRTYDSLYALFSRIYFAFGQPHSGEFGNVLPELIWHTPHGLLAGTSQ